MGCHPECKIHTMAGDTIEATIERIHCNTCRQNTHHERVCKVVDAVTTEYDVGRFIECVTRSETFQCCGCHDVLLRRTRFLEGFPKTLNVQYFPPAVSRHQPSWIWSALLPKGLPDVIHEIYRSLDANNHRLPMMGARTLIDMLMVDRVGDAGRFDEKLKKLEALGVVSARNREVLAAALDVGSAAAHRGHAPKTDEVNAVMDIVENLLHAVYVLPKMAEDLKKTTPPRPSKKRTP